MGAADQNMIALQLCCNWLCSTVPDRLSSSKCKVLSACILEAAPCTLVVLYLLSFPPHIEGGLSARPVPETWASSTGQYEAIIS